MDPCDEVPIIRSIAVPPGLLVPAIKYARIHDAARNSCRRCGMLEECILAVVEGHLPSVFRGARDAAERARILDELVIGERQLIRDYHWKHTQQWQEVNLKMSIMGKWLDIELFRDPEEQPKFTVKGLVFEERAQFGPTTNSDRTLSRAETWLRECTENHRGCGKQVSSFFPKRLLDLRGRRIRLIDTSQTCIQDPYVCLSHRWGCEQHRRLQSTVRSVEDHKQEILYTALPKTFQNAVDVCRRLAVDYLWIDTLCILQEVPDLSAKERRETEIDFATENAAMGSIYRNSYLTICASISTHMDGGMFSKEWSSFAIKVVDDSGKDAVFRIRGGTSHAGPPTDLETRGWTFQEYVLPSRILGFESFDISWRCRQTLTCECQYLRSASDWHRRLADYSRDGPDEHTAGGEWWANMVRYYSKRFLTNEQDKLPALSGLAQVHHRISGDTYLAGIWKASLPNSLCWYRWGSSSGYTHELGRIGIARRPQKFRAPSWSWASIDFFDGSECCFWDFDTSLRRNWDFDTGVVRVTRAACTLYEATCKLATRDPFGEVSDGFVELGVVLTPASIERNDHIEEAGWSEAEMPWTLSNVEDSSDVDICIADCSLEDCDLNLGDVVYCAPILETFSERLSWSRELSRICLVLKRLENLQYQRIGFCILRTKDPDWSYSYSDGEEVLSHSLQNTPDKGVRVVIV
ncbi:hypothetical protein G7054_g14242 [Neopestalotiopsis clavispora]|nr:hypothetical protein G7054_g14242 [Neopestalotiopsis clavispora]